MRTGWSIVASTLALLALLAADAEAGRLIRDTSGAAMQFHDSQMMASPMIRMPTPLGASFWPFIGYPQAPTMTILNIIQVPELNQPPPPPPPPPAPSKFWIARCGVFVELNVSSAMNLMEEERKPCTQ